MRLGWITGATGSMHGKIFLMCVERSMEALARSLKNISAALLRSSLAGRQRLFQNIREKISLSPTIWILNGGDIPMVCSRMWIISNVRSI